MRPTSRTLRGTVVAGLAALAMVLPAVPAVALPEDLVEQETGLESAKAAGLPWMGRTVEGLAESRRAEAGLEGTDIPRSASGDLVPVDLGGLDLRDGPPAEDDEAEGVRELEVRVHVEDGLPVDGQAFAAFVLTVLTDPRGWEVDAAGDPVRFVPSEDDDSDTEVTVVLASPDLVDELCAPLDTGGKYSCANQGRAVLNAARWSGGTEAFLGAGGTLPEYRRYLVNHEVGHLIGYGHPPCPREGEPAPVMLQQSMHLDGCTPNGWPTDRGRELG